MDIKIRGFLIRIPYPVLLLLAALICYWQFAFLRNSLQNDIHDVMLPWRYFAGESLQNGILPLWNPYQQFGYPFFADLQYTNWNPEVWLTGNLTGYSSYYILIFLVFFYVWMAGVGMFRLSHYFSGNKPIAFFIASAYMLSGCLLAHMQQFVTVIGIAWMPFVVWQFFEFIDTLKWKNVFGLSVFSFLLMSSGYQALFFMLIYVFIGVCIYRIIIWWKNSEKEKIIQLLYKGAAIVFVSGVMLLPVLISVKQSAPFVARMDKGVTLEEALFGATTPQSLLSFFLPVTSVKDQEWINTDNTLSNMFFGSIAFLLVLISFFRRQSALQWILISFSFLYLLAAFGEATPVRKFLYDFVPLMNQFRLPGLFRLVTVLLLLVQLSIFLKDYSSIENKKVKSLFLISGLLYFVLAVVFFFTAKNEKFTLFTSSLPFSDSVLFVTANEVYFWQSFIFSLVCFGGYFISGKSSAPVNWNRIALVSFILLFAGIQFNIYFNIAAKTKPVVINEWMLKSPDGFPLPSKSSLRSVDDLTIKPEVLYRNLGNFHKKPMLDEFSSFRFSALNNLSDNFPEIRKQLSFYSLAYLSDSLVLMDTSFRAVEGLKGITFLDNRHKPTLEKLKVDKDDKITCTRFLPDEFAFNVENKNAVIFNLLETYFTGWKILVDGKESNYLLNGDLCMSVPLTAGEHKIEFRYENALFNKVFHVSFALFFLSLAFFLFASGSKRFLALLPLLMYFLTLMIFISRKEKAPEYYSGAQKISKMIDGSNNFILCSHLALPTKNVVYADDTSSLQNAFRRIDANKSSAFYYAWYGEHPDNRVTDYLQSYYSDQGIVYKAESSLYGIVRFSNDKATNNKTYVWGRNSDLDYFGENIRIPDSVNRVAALYDQQPWGPTFRAPCSGLSYENKITALFSFDFSCEANNKSVFVVKVEDSTGTKWERGFVVYPNFIQEKQWNRFAIKVKPELELKSHYNFVGFLMNTNPDTIEVRNYRVEILDEE